MIILDTHIILWDAYNKLKLSENAKHAIEQETEFIFCDISIWEIAMLIQKGRIQSKYPVDEMINSIIKSRNFHMKNITSNIAKIYIDLDDKINKDPADRIIAATAIFEKVPLITADKNLLNSTLIKTIW